MYLDSISDNTIDTGKELALEANKNLNKELNAFQLYLDSLPEKLIAFGIKFVIAVIMLIIGRKIITLVRKLVKKSLTRHDAETGVVQFLDSFVKVALYFMLIVIIINYFGVQTTSLIALMGSAGVTIALALQGSLSNFTGGVLILLLKPFKVGDYIKEDNKNNEGTVIEIQMFYTKLRTIDDKIVLLPNGTLANTSMTNINASPYRRVIMTVGVAYNTDIDKAKTVIRKVIEKDKRVANDKEIDVYVDSLDASQISIGVRFFVKNSDFFEAKWDAIEEIKNALDKAGITIPYSQMDVHIINDNKS